MEVNKKTNVVELNKDQQESLRILFSVAEKAQRAGVFSLDEAVYVKQSMIHLEPLTVSEKKS
ncbi:hypothetical protein [Tenacibaculum litopenaei]|uniref:hypothetical protein n=1 Tax=Tenacibaculum litopenaei TaxID=396016 RepID=UPI0038B4DFBE